MCWLFHKWGKWVFHGEVVLYETSLKYDKKEIVGKQHIYLRKCSRCDLEDFRRVRV